MIGAKWGYDITSGSYLSSRGHPARALPVGIGKTRGGIAKQVGFAAGKLEQPLLRHRVGLDGAVGTNVAGRHSALGQSAADQQTAVAIERLALRAQETYDRPAGWNDRWSWTCMIRAAATAAVAISMLASPGDVRADVLVRSTSRAKACP